jgi:hypothetical protein
MFKVQDPNTQKVLETIFKKNFPDKSFSNLVHHKSTKGRTIFKDNTDNKYYTMCLLGKSQWKEITDPDIIEKL